MSEHAVKNLCDTCIRDDFGMCLYMYDDLRTEVDYSEGPNVIACNKYILYAVQVKKCQKNE